MLVVEDNQINRLIVVHMLQRLGLEVFEAGDGEEALAAMHRGGLSLVLMDGQMPVLDGYAATRQWRELERRLGTPRLPIVAMTANTFQEDLDLARDCGMDDHLAKPFLADDLARTVTRWLAPAAGGSPGPGRTIQ